MSTELPNISRREFHALAEHIEDLLIERDKACLYGLPFSTSLPDRLNEAIQQLRDLTQ